MTLLFTFLDNLAGEAAFPMTAFCPPRMDAGAPEVIIEHHDFARRLADCPCNNPNTVTATCPTAAALFVGCIVQCRSSARRPRARSRRRRACSAARGRSSDPGDGPAGPSPDITEISRRAA